MAEERKEAVAPQALLEQVTRQVEWMRDTGGDSLVKMVGNLKMIEGREDGKLQVSRGRNLLEGGGGVNVQ